MPSTIKAVEVRHAEIRELSVADVEAVSGARMKLLSAAPVLPPPDPHSGGSTGYTLVFWKMLIAGSLT